jgi:uncharacterized membrane protein
MPRWWTRRIVFVLAVLMGVYGLSWMVSGETSPLHEYFQWHTTIPTAWAMLNLPAILLGVTVSGNVHRASYAAVVIGMTLQWGCLALLLSLALFRARGRQNRLA